MIISIIIFLLLSIILVSFTSQATKIKSYIINEQEILADLKLTLDFFEMQIRNSIEIIIPENNNGEDIILQIVTYQRNTSNKNLSTHSFIFKRDSSDYKLYFGGRSNELSKYIKDININYIKDTNILEIKIIPKNNKKNKLNFESIYKQIYVGNKIISKN